MQLSRCCRSSIDVIHTENSVYALCCVCYRPCETILTAHDAYYSQTEATQ